MKNRKHILTLSIIKTAFILPILFILCLNCSHPKATDIQNDILKNKGSFYYLDVKNYPENRRSLPVGIFDSGTGGLAVMNDIVDFRGFADSVGLNYNPPESPRVFNNESFIYLADLANMPYGSYALENNSALLVEHILKDVQFLIGNKYYQTAGSPRYMSDKEPVKAIVIACNTATAYGLDIIRSFIDRTGLDIGVIGVIDAGASAAIRNFGLNESGSIAVLATDGTVKSGAYVSTCKSWIKDFALDSDIHIFQQAGIGIAEAIDESRDFIDRSVTLPRDGYKGPSDSGAEEMFIDLSLWERYDFKMDEGAMLFNGDPDSPKDLQINSVENYISFHLVSLMEKIRKEEGVQPLKSVILGCTHYPFFEEAFRETLSRLRDYKEEDVAIYRPYIAENVLFINPGVYVAGQLYDYLSRKKLLNDGKNVLREFYISIPNVLNNQVMIREDGSFTYDYKYGRKAGEIQEYVKIVPFSRQSLPDDILYRLSIQIPLVYDYMIRFNHQNSKADFLQKDDRIVLLN